jgi:coniferyl-aldehyde dehydrogenase
MEVKKSLGRIDWMNSSGNSMDSAATRIRKVFAAQRAAFKADPYPLAERRRVKIKALKRQISRYQDVLTDAMSKDFGFRAPTESKMLDLLGSTLEANHAIAHLKRWMKPSRRATGCCFSPTSCR